MEYLIAAGVGAALVVGGVLYYVIHRKLSGVASDLLDIQTAINKLEAKIPGLQPVTPTVAPVVHA